LRGRYGKGPTKLNLSKSGVSVSTKNALGTFNWIKPNRSSVKLGGVQIRGKNAATIQMIYAMFALALFAIKLVIVLALFGLQMLWVVLQLLFIFLCWLIPVLWSGGQFLIHALCDAVRAGQRARLKVRAGDLADQLSQRSHSELEALLTHIVTVCGRGEAGSPEIAELLATIDAKNAADRLRILLLAVTRQYQAIGDPSRFVPLYLQLDDQCVQQGGRTRLQDLLLADYAALNKLGIDSDAGYRF
jgi:hypothetical protein